MSAKKRITREEVITAALDLVRQGSPAALTARGVAAALGCSTQPIFSNFANMEDLRLAVIERAWRLYLDRTAADMAAGRYPPYKASGMSYIAFAVQEPHLFELLFMRNRIALGETVDNTHPKDVIDAIMRQTGMDDKAARQFHSEMWVFVHGLAVMAVTGFAPPDEAAASEMLSDVYQGLCQQFRAKGVKTDE